jgi:hypothetical protein
MSCGFRPHFNLKLILRWIGTKIGLDHKIEFFVFMSPVIMISLLIVIIIVSLADFFTLLPILLAIVFKGFQSLHRHVTSDIPGNPHAFDDAVISLFRTLPEPSNFNLIWTGIPLQGQAVRVRGRKPKCRLNSLTVYNSTRMSDPPISIDLESIPTDESGMFEVILAHGKDSSLSDNPNARVINCQHLSRCMVAMRNYLVPPGVLVETPTILNDQGVAIRSSEALIAGPASLRMAQDSRINIQRLRLLIFNIIAAMIIVFYLQQNYLICMISLFISGLIAIALRSLCFQLGRLTLRKMISVITKEKNHKFFYPNTEESSTASQPSQLHKYWVMSYDMSHRKVSCLYLCGLSSRPIELASVYLGI